MDKINNTAYMVKPLTIQWSVAVVVQCYQGQQHNSCMNDDAIVCHSMRMIFAVLSSMAWAWAGIRSRERLC